MIFADSLPFAKTFFAAAGLPVSTVGLLTRFVVACLSTLHSASQAGCAIRIDPRHRAQLVRFLARHGWSKDWLTLQRLADVVLDACLHEHGDWLLILDQTTDTTVGLHAQNTYCCRNTKKRQKNSSRKQKKTPPKLNHVFVCAILISPQTGTRIPCVRPYYTEEYCKQLQAQANPGKPAYRVRNFHEVEGWVQACCVALCYLEYYRLRRWQQSSTKEWWFRQRVKGLRTQVLQDIEALHLEHIATHMDSEEGRRWLRERLRKAVPLEQSRPA
jgi:hypothetical protein